MIAIQEFGGLDLRSSFMRMAMEDSPAAENMETTGGRARGREGLVATSYLDSAASHVSESILGQVLRQRRNFQREMIWAQGTKIFTSRFDAGSLQPQALNTAAAEGLQLDAALTSSTRSQKWGSYAGRGAVWAESYSSRTFMVDGAGMPMRVSDEGLHRWGIFQPRALKIGPQTVAYTTNSVVQGGGNNNFFTYGNPEYAFTYVRKEGTWEVESNPIFVNHASTRALTVSGNAHVPWAANAGVRTIQFYIQDPPDPQVTHIRVYRSVGVTMRRMAEFAPTAAGIWGWGIDADDPDDLARYSDDALINAIELETNHNPPPCLGGIWEQEDRIIGWPTWDPSWLPGLRSTSANDATADVALAATTPASGYVVKIKQSGANPSYRVAEHLVGMTIRFPRGSNRPYLIWDAVNWSGNALDQYILIGHPIGYPDAVIEEIEEDDLDLADTDFVIEAPKNLIYWSQRGRPEYWDYTSFRPIGADDNETITNGFVCNKRSVITKQNRTYSIGWRINPSAVNGDVEEVSDSVGCPTPHAFTKRPDGIVEIRHTSGFYACDGSSVDLISQQLGDSISAGVFSSYLPSKHLTIHLDGGETALVHDYRRRKWHRWRYHGKSLTSVYCGQTSGSGGTNNLWFGDANGRHWLSIDTRGSVGLADGHAATLDTTFFPRSKATAAAAIGTLIDTTNAFVDHTANGASLIGDSIRVFAGKGAGQTGTITARVSANQLTITGFTIALDETSEYEIGYVDSFWRTPHFKVADVGQELKGARIFIEPKTWNALGERHRHEKDFFVQWFSGMRMSNLTAMEVENLRDGDHGDVDKGTGVPLFRVGERRDGTDAWLVDYTNNTFAATSGTDLKAHRTEPHPGHVLVPVYAQATYAAVEFGEERTRGKLEVFEILLGSETKERPRR